MGKLFDLDPEVIQIARDGLDDLLLVDVLGKTCTLCYAPVWSACAGCLALAPQGAAGDRWITGGHAPGRSLGCTACGGTGQMATTPTESIVLLCSFYDGRDAHKIVTASVTASSNFASTRGYMTDVGKVMRAEFLLVQVDLAAQLRLKFERISDPVDKSNIVKGRYFTCEWRRVP